MIDNFLKLLYIRFKNQLGVSKLNDISVSVKYHSRITFIGYCIAFILLLSYFVYLPFQMFKEGEIRYVNSYVTNLLFWILAIWTCLSGGISMIYSSDHDYIFSLPLEKWQAKLSIIIYQYILYFILTFVLCLGTQITLILIEHTAINNLIYIILLSICIPSLAIIMSMMITIIVRSILHFLKVNSHLIVSLLSFVLLVTPIITSYVKQGMTKPKLGIINSTILSFPILGGLSMQRQLTIVGIVVFTFIMSYMFLITVSYKYDNLITLFRNKSNTLSTNYQLDTRSPFTSLLKREIKLYTSSFSYMSNTSLMPILLLAVSIIYMLYGNKLIPELVLYNKINISSDKIYYILFTTCLVLTTTTSCAISIEGRKIWILESLPISILEISCIKLILNILLFIPGLLFVFINCLTMDLHVVQFIQAVFLLISNLIFVSYFGLFINLKFPNFNWSNEMEVVKQGISTILTAVVSMILVGVTSLLVIFTNFSYLFILTIVEVLLVIYFINTLRDKSYFKSS